MKEYEPRFPMKRITPPYTCDYRDLLEDNEGNIISQNVTWLCERKDDFSKTSEMLEEIVKRRFGKIVEVRYKKQSGNIYFILFSKNKSDSNKLEKMQSVYSELYRKFERIRNKKEKL